MTDRNNNGISSHRSNKLNNSSIDLPDTVYDFYKYVITEDEEEQNNKNNISIDNYNADLFEFEKEFNDENETSRQTKGVKHIIFSSMDVNQRQNSLNKISKLFYRLYEISVAYHQNDDFLKIYENFKPYLKFLKLCLQNLGKNELHKRKKVMVIDDNKIILKSLYNLTKKVIESEKLNFEVIKAYDGVDALALFKIDKYINQSISYVISDHNMTMMNGVDLMELLKLQKKERGKLELFICSTDNDLLMSKKLDYLKFLSKPLRKSDLIKAFKS